MMRSWLTFCWEPTFWLCASPIGWDSRGWLRNLRRDYFCTAARLFNEPGLQLPLRRLWSTFQTQKWLWTRRVWLCRQGRGDVEGRELCILETLGRSRSLPVNWLSTASSLHEAGGGFTVGEALLMLQQRHRFMPRPALCHFTKPLPLTHIGEFLSQSPMEHQHVIISWLHWKALLY